MERIDYSVGKFNFTIWIRKESKRSTKYYTIINGRPTREFTSKVKLTKYLHHCFDVAKNNENTIKGTTIFYDKQLNQPIK